MPKTAKYGGGRTRNSKTDEFAIVRAKRVAAILARRTEGLTIAEIAREEKLTPSRIHTIIKKALADIVIDPAEEVKKLELARLDRMFGKHFVKATGGDSVAVTACLAIMDRRARYLGLDKATQPEDAGALSDAKASMRAKLQRMADRFMPGLLAAEAAQKARLIEGKAAEEPPANGPVL